MSNCYLALFTSMLRARGLNRIFLDVKSCEGKTSACMNRKYII